MAELLLIFLLKEVLVAHIICFMVLIERKGIPKVYCTVDHQVMLFY